MPAFCDLESDPNGEGLSSVYRGGGRDQARLSLGWQSKKLRLGRIGTEQKREDTQEEGGKLAVMEHTDTLSNTESKVQSGGALWGYGGSPTVGGSYAFKLQ